jgi:ribosomal protein S18 acetylase RimI-like enzyme
MTQQETLSEQREHLDVNVRKATQADLPEVINTLGRAFDDDPLINWMVAQDANRQRRVRDAMDLSQRMVFRHGECYTTDGYYGAALWAPPGKWHLGVLAQLRLTPSLIRVTGWKRLAAVSAGVSAIERKHPHDDHYYLFVLGTDTVHQGKGVGSQVLRPVLERCDREHMPAYLESSKEKNVPFYERNGFKVRERFEVPNGGPPIWLMWREPQ